MLEKISHMIMLKDFYGPLLTPKQQDIMNLYYENDLSLTEIADIRNVTRQAVYDIIKRAAKTLEEYEQRLGLVEKFMTARQDLNEVYILLDNKKPERDSISRAIQILKKVIELV
ncbi:MAG: YlxM family DNA-binding protein [Syntrophomonas sp.]